MTTTLYVGGHVYSSTVPAATSVVVEGDSIGWVGTGGDDHRDTVDEVVELDGALLAPAFVDAHVHTTSAGLTLLGLDLTQTKSAAELLDRVREHARILRGGAVLGHGWDETRWSAADLPTRQQLDQASYGSVVYLSRIDVHSCLASSALLALAPEVQTDTGYDASGWLRQDAHHRVRAVAFESVTADQRRRAQRTARNHAASRGVGMLHEAGGPEIGGVDDFVELLDLAMAEAGPEVIGYWAEAGGPESALRLGATGAAGDLFIDGAIGSRTAYLREDYFDDDTRGAQYLSVTQIADHLIACSRAGVQAGFHVIGDGAMDELIEAFRRTEQAIGAASVRAARHRLEHVEMIDDSQIRVLVDLGVVASVQPVFDELWGGPSGMYATRLGVERGASLNPLATMAGAGLPLAFGSDAPVTPIDPWRAIRAATQHHTESSRLSLEAGFAAHTRGGWFAAGKDNGGVIAPGAPASLAIWQTDSPLTRTGLPDLAPDHSMPQCLRTVVRGTTVFTHERAGAAL